MSTIAISLVALLCLAVALRILEERGLKCIGLAPHQVKFPGPSPVPFFGNFLELRNGHARTFMRWADKFGPIIRIVIGDREAVILNTYNAVQKTLISQGQAFQGRPEFRMYHGLFAMAADHDAPPTLGTSPWTDKISTYRKHLGLQTAGHKLRRYNHFVARRLFRFVDLLATDSKKGPRDLGFAMWTTSIGLSADMCFGTRIGEEEARVISYSEIDIFREPRTLGQPLHIAVPILDMAQKALRPAYSLLRTLGLTSFLDEVDRSEDAAKKLRMTEIGYVGRLKEETKARVRAGDATPSQLGDIIRTFGDSYTAHDEYKVATSLVGSGMGTGTLILWLAALLASRPDIQAEARAAIDAEYAGEVPDPLDTDRVEYISALGIEAGRYFASTRLGFPRETTEDVEVDGVHIPKGTVVMHNTYSVNRDPARYDRPDEFLPERWCAGHYGFVNQKGPRVGVPHLNNGVGRRYCLGVPYVNKVLYGTIILLLHFFELQRDTLDAEGRKEVFPAYRADVAEASATMDPITDQVTECAAQALPRAAGVRLTPRDPAQLAHWLAEGHADMDQFERPDESEGLRC
ncbi:putative cytochrome P450 phenylacetate 2-hydroxylase [Peniophora sp. CONT]|nr:putative cytochrome P450 phenylacetate 2-hydroxylase [Peniophora sp. CONT]